MGNLSPLSPTRPLPQSPLPYTGLATSLRLRSENYWEVLSSLWPLGGSKNQAGKWEPGELWRQQEGRGGRLFGGLDLILWVLL